MIVRMGVDGKLHCDACDEIVLSPASDHKCKEDVWRASLGIEKATPAEESANELDELLEERGKRYGRFADHAVISQELKEVLARHDFNRGRRLMDDQREALSMICHKIARIVNGDPDYADSWVDIAGYAMLVADRLGGKAR